LSGLLQAEGGANVSGGALNVIGAANDVAINGASTGNPVVLQSFGADTDVGINVVTKGSGVVTANGTPVALVTNAAAATLATNPPVSGTAYQWAGPGTLSLAIPVTFNQTSTAAATAALAIGPTSTPATQIDYSSRPTGLVAGAGEVETLKAEVPAGWYWSLTVAAATIGTAAAIVH
jgi:hypothetical protein